MNPIELLIVGILVVLATAYVVRSALAKYRRKSSQPCAGCGCGKSDLIPAKRIAPINNDTGGLKSLRQGS